MSVKKTSSGYLIDFTLNNERYRESVPAPHNTAAYKRICLQQDVYRMAISLSDQTIAKKYPNSKILQKAFKTKDELTIGEFAKVYFVRNQNRIARSTRRGYEQKYYSYIEPNWGHIRLCDFKPGLFHEWASQCGLSGKTINHTRNVLGQIFKCAFFDEVIEKNPISLIKPYQEVRFEPNPFTLDEQRRILSELSSPFKEYFTLAFQTGLRTNELIALRWQDIDFESMQAHIRVAIVMGEEKQPKTKGSIRSVKLNQAITNQLKKLRATSLTTSYRIFVNPRDKSDFKNPDSIRKYVWQPALSRAKVKYRYPYQCRHTFASVMLSSGSNPMEVSTQMGHSDWGMIRKTYGRWIPT